MFSAVLLLAGCSGLFSGCASPGPPRAPSLQLPEPVKDLSAERFGNRVQLHWTAPALTTDHETLAGRKHAAGPLEAELCRATVSRGHCDVVVRLPVTAGQPASAEDTLSGNLAAGRLRPLFYSVRILNGAGHSAETARETVTAAGQAPPDVTGLQASTNARGLQLTWQKERVVPGERLLLRVEPAGPAGAAKQNASTAPRNLSVRLDGNSSQPGSEANPGSDPGGTIDPALRDGEQARYTVVRTIERTLAGQAVVVNGGAATLTATRERDTFPPAIPGGLAALAVQLDGAPPEIDLSWEPDTEPDLLGYFVERAPAVGGDFQRLNARPLAAVSYRDLQVSAGTRYRYAVVAVDRSGNESARSPVVQEGLRP